MHSEIVVGRAHTCDVVIDATVVSREHCRIGTDANGLYIIDMNSANGTYVNGQRLSPGTRISLPPGSRVTAGANTEIDLNVVRARLEGQTIQAPPPPPIAPPPAPAAVPAPAPQPVSQPTPQPSQPPQMRPAVATANACPNCGSGNIMSLAVFNQKHNKEVKVKGGGGGGCLTCLLIIILFALFGPLLLAVFGGAAVLGAVGLAGVALLITENLHIVIPIALIILVGTIVVKLSEPKWICEKCGKKWR